VAKCYIVSLDNKKTSELLTISVHKSRVGAVKKATRLSNNKDFKWESYVVIEEELEA